MAGQSFGCVLFCTASEATTTKTTAATHRAHTHTYTGENNGQIIQTLRLTLTHCNCILRYCTATAAIYCLRATFVFFSFLNLQKKKKHASIEIAAQTTEIYFTQIRICTCEQSCNHMHISPISHYRWNSHAIDNFLLFFFVLITLAFKPIQTTLLRFHLWQQ